MKLRMTDNLFKSFYQSSICILFISFTTFLPANLIFADDKNPNELETVKVMQDIVLQKNASGVFEFRYMSIKGGDDFCAIEILKKPKDEDFIEKQVYVLKNNTSLEVEARDVETACGYDFKNNCRLKLGATNNQLGIELNLYCKDIGISPKIPSVNFVNEFIQPYLKLK